MLAPAAIAAIVAAPFVGSFIGLCVDRLPRGLSVVGGRSRCDGCRRALGPVDLLPFVGFALASGRCRICRAPIPRALLAFEAAALAIGVVAAIARPGGGAGALVAALLGWGLLLMAALDWRDLWLPRAGSLALGTAGVALAAMRGTTALLEATLGVAVGWGSLALVASVYRRVRGRRGLGGGDPPFFAAAGAWVGWAGLPAILLIASLMGLAVALAARPAPRTRRIPLGSFLAFGWWLVFLAAPAL